jgi:MoaA/NifB/PqqE/SkfB family radical SAM enzyme
MLWSTVKKILHIPEKMPRFVQIAVTNICNKDCGMCIRFQVPIEQRHLDFEDFKKIVAQFNGQVEAVTLVGMGEPLVYPHLFDAIRYLKERGIKARITTNAILLKKRADKLIEAGLDHIHLSAEDVRDTVTLDAIKDFVQKRDANGTGRPSIVLQPILFGGDEKEGGRSVQDVYDLIEWGANNGVDRVNIARVDLRTDPTMQRPNIAQEKEIFKELGRLRKKYNMRIDCLQDQVFNGFAGFAYKYLKHLLRLDSYCYRFQDYTYIDVTGNVHPCPIDMEQIMGNVFETDLQEVWKGEKYCGIRKDQESYRFCRTCDFLKLKQVSPR